MKTIAKVTLLGIVGNNPEIRQTQSGMTIATFPLATMIRKKSPNGDPVEHTLWHNIVCFGKPAENAQKIVVKGSKLYLDGTIDYQEYIDQQGNKKTSTKIIMNDFSVIANKPQTQAAAESIGNTKQADDFFSDIPF